MSVNVGISAIGHLVPAIRENKRDGRFAATVPSYRFNLEKS